MSEALACGAVTRRRVTVDKPRTIDFMGEDCRVYATPELVRDIEMTCRDFIKANVEAGQDSVGTRVAIDHMAASLLGMEVEIEVRVAARDGRAVHFEFECRDPHEVCARGEHHRFIVDTGKTAERLRAKAARGAGGAG